MLTFLEKYGGLSQILFICLVLAYLCRNKLGQLSAAVIHRRTQNEEKPYLESTVTPEAEEFKWNEAPPLKSFPFKAGEYKLTMGIRRLQLQDWLLIEPTYKKHIEEKMKIINNKSEKYPPDKNLRRRTVFFKEEALPALKELYQMIVDYMCNKYPMSFLKKDGLLHNHILNTKVPASAADVDDPYELLESLAETIEEDFIILLKDPKRNTEKDSQEYFFKAGIFGFAAGFNPMEKFDKPLSFIHEPIPGYEAKLKMSMNRFFDRISPGEFVQRGNFSVQLHDKFYVDDSNKGHNTPGLEQKAIPIDELDFDKQVHYRSERQTLTKLPQSGAIIFTIRTYLLPMSELKKESVDVRKRLIGAIEGLKGPIAEYKRSGEWGPPVIEYLSEGL